MNAKKLCFSPHCQFVEDSYKSFSLLSADKTFLAFNKSMNSTPKGAAAMKNCDVATTMDIVTCRETSVAYCDNHKEDYQCRVLSGGLLFLFPFCM